MAFNGKKRMRLYFCPTCNERVFFENLICACGTELRYDHQTDEMIVGGEACANRNVIGCNWVTDEGQELCQSCILTRTRPDISIQEMAKQWHEAEAAKRWVLANFMQLGWFTQFDTGTLPIFDLLGEETRDGEVKPMTGHANGVITINVAEADSVEVVNRRQQMGEPYRTMLGHFRHELAHFLFLRRSSDAAWLESFREVFGDERTDYAAALEQHYNQNDDGSWHEDHISYYASAHPHEDWAESAAHALHLHDILDSAHSLELRWPTSSDNLDRALDLGIALNHLNRSMGLDDAYPFVVSPRVRQKLAFAYAAIKNVHEDG